MADHVAGSLVSFRWRYEIPAICGLPGRTAAIYIALFTAGFVLYTWLWASAPVIQPDSGSYLRTAKALTEPWPGPVFERTLGYPLFLVMTSSNYTPGRTLFVSSLLLHFVSVWLLAVVLYRCGVRTQMLPLFGLILLLPPYVEPTAYVLTETLAGAMLVIGFAALVLWALNFRTGWLVAGAMAIAYAALTRPTFQLLAVAVVVFGALARSVLPAPIRKAKSLLMAAAIILGFSVLFQAGGALVAYRTTGRAGGNSILGLALTQKTARVLERLPEEHAAIRDTLIRARNRALTTDTRHTGSAYVEPVIPELVSITGMDKAQLSDHLVRLNLMLILSAPAEYLQEVVWALGSYWFPAAGELANLKSRSLQLVWAIVHFCVVAGFAVSLLVLAGAATYIASAFRKLGRAVPVNHATRLSFLAYGLAATIVFYSAAVSCVIQDGAPRYRRPTDGLIVLMLFLGFHLWRDLVDQAAKFVRHQTGASVPLELT